MKQSKKTKIKIPDLEPTTFTEEKWTRGNHHFKGPKLLRVSSATQTDDDNDIGTNSGQKNWFRVGDNEKSSGDTEYYVNEINIKDASTETKAADYLELKNIITTPNEHKIDTLSSMQDLKHASINASFEKTAELKKYKNKYSKYSLCLL